MRHKLEFKTILDENGCLINVPDEFMVKLSDQINAFNINHLPYNIFNKENA